MNFSKYKFIIQIYNPHLCLLTGDQFTSNLNDDEMPLPNILRKANNYILGGCEAARARHYSAKIMSVCIPPTLMRHHADVVHHSGYMTITTLLAS